MSDRNLPVPVVTHVEPAHDVARLKERARVYGARQEEADAGPVKHAIEVARALAGKLGPRR